MESNDNKFSEFLSTVVYYTKKATSCVIYFKRSNADKAEPCDKRLFKMQCLRFIPRVSHFFVSRTRRLWKLHVLPLLFFLQHVFAAVPFNRREVLYRINHVMQFHRSLLLIATVVSSAELLIASYFSCNKGLPRFT